MSPTVKMRQMCSCESPVFVTVGWHDTIQIALGDCGHILSAISYRWNSVLGRSEVHDLIEPPSGPIRHLSVDIRPSGLSSS